MRKQNGQWWHLVQEADDLTDEEARFLETHAAFLLEVEITPMTKSFKAVLLESFLEMDGFRNLPSLERLAVRALSVFRRRRTFVADIREDLRDLEQIDHRVWASYWKGNPVNAWVEGNRKKGVQPWFVVKGELFQPTFLVTDNQIAPFELMVQEVVDYRLAAYAPRLPTVDTEHVVPFPEPESSGAELPYFPDLRIACGNFFVKAVRRWMSIGESVTVMDA